MSGKKVLHGSILFDATPVEVLNKFINCRTIPEYPLVQLNAKVVESKGFNRHLQHFMLESLVETSEVYVVCSLRYEMNIESSKHIMIHMQEFHRQFVEKCEDIKKNFKLP